MKNDVSKLLKLEVQVCVHRWKKNEKWEGDVQLKTQWCSESPAQMRWGCLNQNQFFHSLTKCVGFCKHELFLTQIFYLAWLRN